jgi:hypothetical protein
MPPSFSRHSLSSSSKQSFDHLDDSGRELGRQYNDRLEIAAACDRSGFRGYHVAEG